MSVPDVQSGDDPRQLDFEDQQDHGWTQTKSNPDTKIWWKTGSTHVNGAYTQMRCVRLTESWVVKVTSYNDYGMTESSRTLYQKDIDRADDVGERALSTALDFMRENPAKRPFDGEPGVPEQIGDWTLITDELHTWVWAENNRELEVDETRIEGRYCGHTTYYEVVYQSPTDERHTVFDETIGLRALRSAERCLRANPSGKIGNGDAYEQLQEINGVGPAKALQLQLLGVTDSATIRHAVTNTDDTPYELRTALDTLLTSRIEADLGV